MAAPADWGSVLAWEPHTRLVLSWDINADWQYDPELKTEIEVRFIADGTNGTRVELEHRRLDRYGAQARPDARHLRQGRRLGALARDVCPRRCRDGILNQVGSHLSGNHHDARSASQAAAMASVASVTGSAGAQVRAEVDA